MTQRPGFRFPPPSSFSWSWSISAEILEPLLRRPEYIRRQRELQKLSMRHLAGLVGISNPYLSQIERGLRDPSEKVLDAIADNLEVSAETLHAEYAEQKRAQRAERDDDGTAVVDAIRADPRLTATPSSPPKEEP